MNIAIVCSTAFGGGAENSMQTLHSEFRSRGITSTFLALNKDLYEEPNPRLSDNQLCFERNWDSGLLSLLQLKRKMTIFLKSQDPSHIIVNCELAELVVALAPTRGVRIYCVEHTSQPWIGKRPLGFLIRLILKLKGCKWITVSSKASSHPLCERNSTHIPNPISVPLHQRKDIHGFLNPRLLFAGRLSSEKRPEWCLEVASSTGLPLDMFGQGPLLEELKLRATKLKANVLFHGYTSNFWTKIDLDNSILIAPSEYEGDGMVIAEAVISGLPVVVSDNADLRRFNLPESCYARNPKEFIEKIDGILSGDASKYLLGRTFIQELRESRSIQKIGDLWILELNRI